MKRWFAFRSVLLKGFQWSLISTAFTSIAGILYFGIASRFLEPSDFGIFSLSLIFLGFIDFFSGAGASAVIIQDKKLSQLQYSTFFWLNLVLGLGWAIILFFFSSIIADYFKNEDLNIIVQIISVTAFFQSISLLHNNILRREILVSKLEKIDMVGSFIQMALGISLAVGGFAFLSLPLAYAVSKIFIAIANIWVGRLYFWPSTLFHLPSIKPQLSLGSFQILEKIFNYIRSNADKFFIGKFLGTDSLGWYSLAQKIIDLPLSKINPGLNKILFPYFSKLQFRPLVISNIYMNVIALIISLVVPVLLFVLFFAPTLVSMLFGHGYEPVVPVLQLLSILGLLRSISNIGGNILNALGKFKVGFIWNFWWALSLVCILYISVLFNVNLNQITCIILFANIFSFFAWHTIINTYIRLPFKDLILKFMSVSLISASVLIIGFMLNYWSGSVIFQYVSLIFSLVLTTSLVYWHTKPYIQYFISKTDKTSK